MLTLASRLRALDDAALRRMIGLRQLPAHGIDDFFDLAEALLDPDAIQTTLARLDRSSLAVLAVAGELGAPTLTELVQRLDDLGHDTISTADVCARADRLDALMLALREGDTVRPYPAVVAQLRRWPEQGLPGTSDLAGMQSPTPLVSLSATEGRFTERLSAERAFAAVSSIAELINELAREPARELSRGGLGLPDSKRLSAAMGVALEQVPAFVSIAVRAELVALHAGYWAESVAGEAWLVHGSAERWAALAESWLAALPTDVREILARRPGVAWGEALHRYVAWLYPAGGSWMAERIADFARDAELIGITAKQVTSTAGAAVLSGDIDAAIDILTGYLPAEVGTVYLQHDLSIVAPGPLSRAIDSRLRGFADVESRDLASSYRLSAASVTRALTAGDDAESMVAFLASISLTGIPQPVDYLIRDTAARYGRVRVGSIDPANPAGPGYVSSTDEALLGTIAVDQTLGPLALVPSPDGRLRSILSADRVFWALSDARYPVVAENAAGDVVHLRRHALARVSAPPVVDPAVGLVEKLRTTDGGEAKAASAWLTRQLDAAIKHRESVMVSIRMPDGEIVDYLLEPASVGGGRFRARDRRADIERTLPLNSVVSINPAP